MADEVNQIVKSRRIGMKNVYVAPIVEDDFAGYKAGTPVQLARAISGKITSKKTATKEYSDDAVEDIIETFDSGSIELQVNDLSPQMEALLFGSRYENGFLVDSANDVSNPVALGWCSRRSDGKYEFIWLYVCRFDEGAESDYQSIEDKQSVQHPTLKGEILPRQIDGQWRNRVNGTYLLDTYTDAKTAIANWFKEVQEPVKQGAGATTTPVASATE